MRQIIPLALLATFFFAQDASGQSSRPDPYAARRLLGAQSYTWEGVRSSTPSYRNPLARSAPVLQPMSQPLGGAARGVLDYYGGARARATLAQIPSLPSSATAAPQPVNSRPASKPFNTVVNEPTVSPYLNLYREERGDAAPNYYAFVRPQQRQIEANRRQSANLQRIERNVRQASYTPSGGVSTGGSRAARYGDTGRYYSSWR